MLYNKRQVRKANDKKVLHKVGKQWRVVSLALLMAIGGVGLATHVSAHADTTNNNNRANADSTNTIKERLNSSLQKTSAQGSQANVNTSSHQSRINSQSITNQASVLHNRILQNAANRKSVSAQSKQTTPKVGSQNEDLRQRIDHSSQSRQIATPHVHSVGSINPNSHDQYFSDVPVTVVYANAKGQIQTASDGDNKRIATKYIQIGANNNGKGQHYTGLSDNDDKVSVDMSDATNTISDHYSKATNTSNYTWTVNGGSYHINPGSYAVNPNSVSSVYNQSNHTWADWDSVNNRPLIVMQSTHKGSAQDNNDQIIVNFYNETGQKLGSHTLTGDYGDTINTQNLASDYLPDGSDYTTYDDNPNNNDIKNNYTFSDTPQNITIPLVGKNTVSDTNTNNWRGNASKSNGQWSNGDLNKGQADSNNKVTVNFTLKNHDGSTKTVNKDIYLNGQVGNFIGLDPHDFLNQTPDPQYDPRHQIQVANNPGLNGGKIENNKYLDIINPDYNPMGWKHLNSDYNPQVDHYYAQDPNKVYNNPGNPADPNNGHKGVIDNNEYTSNKNSNYNPLVWVHNNPNYNPGTTQGAKWSNVNGGNVDNQQYTPDETEGANGYQLAKDIAAPNAGDVKALLNPSKGEQDNYYAVNPDYNPRNGAPEPNPNYESSTSLTYKGTSLLYSLGNENNVTTTNKAYNPYVKKLGLVASVLSSPEQGGQLLNPAKPYNNNPNAAPMQRALAHPAKPEEDNYYLDGSHGSTATPNSNYNPMIWQKVNANYNPDVTNGGAKPVNNQKYIIDSTADEKGEYNVSKNAPQNGDTQVALNQAQWNQNPNLSSGHTTSAPSQEVENNFYTIDPNYNPRVDHPTPSNPAKPINNNRYVFLLRRKSPDDTQTLKNPAKPENNQQQESNPDYNPAKTVNNPNYHPNQFLSSKSPFADSALNNYVVDPENADDKIFYLKGAKNGSGKPEAITYSDDPGGGHNSDIKLTNGKTVHPTHDIGLVFDQSSNYGNSQPITLTYKDHNGNKVGSDVITPTKDAYGQTIDMTNSDSTINGKYNISDVANGKKSSDSSTFKGAKGMNVPNGYTIDPNQTTKFTVNSDAQNPVVYVTGNRLTTNGDNDPHTLTVNVNEQLYNTDGQPVTSGVSKPGWNANGTKTITLHPHISGRIGDTRTLYASLFQPSRNYVNNELSSGEQSALQLSSSDYANPSGTSSYQMKFAPSDVTDLDGNKAGTTDQGKAFGTADGNVDFSFNVYPQQATYTTNHVYYVSASDVDAFSHGMDDINQDFNRSDFITAKSDRGIPGKTSFNDAAYRENVPLGYQFDRVLGTKTNGHWNNPNYVGTNNVPGLNGYADTDQDEVIEVVPNAKPIHFRYVDQNGKDIKDYSDSATMSNYVKNDGAHGYNSKWGQPVSTTDIEKNVPDHANELGIPDGYQVSPHNPLNQSPKFSRYDQNVTVEVVGNKVNPQQDSNDVAKVYVHEEDPEGHIVTKTYSDNDYVDGRIGDSFSINASDYIPNGYQIDSNQGKDQTVKGTIQQDGVVPNTANFYYKPVEDHNPKDLKPVNVVFKDGNAQVGYESLNPSNSDYSGESVDVRNLHDYTVPSGYQLVPNQNYNATLSTSVDPTVNLQVYNPKVSDAGIIQITQKRWHNNSRKDPINSQNDYMTVPTSDGTTFTDVAVHGKKGTSQTINPNDYQLSGYADSGKNDIYSTWSASTTQGFSDALETVKFSNDGSNHIALASDTHHDISGTNRASGTNINWDYLAKTSNGNGNVPANPNQPGPVGPKTSDVQPIYVQYYLGSGTSTPLKSDGSNGSDDIRVDGYMNQDYPDITQANAKTAQILGSGYHLTGIQNLNYKITNQEQQVDLHVAKNNAKDATEGVNLQLEDPSGNKTGNPISVHPLTISDGQVVTIQSKDFLNGNPDFTPNGYSDGSNHDKSSSDTYNIKNDNGALKAYNLQTGAESNVINPITFDYKAKSNNSDANVQPLYFNFYNKQGQQVGQANQQMNSYNGPLYSGEKINILSDGDHTLLNSNVLSAGIIMPSDYSHLVPNQNDQYIIGNQPQTVNLIVQGDEDSADKFPINRYVYGNSADPVHPNTVNYNGPVHYGSDFNVNANNYKVNPGDNVVPGTQTSDEVSVNPNPGHSPFDPNQANFYYDTKPTGRNDGPLMVKYVNQSGDTVKVSNVVNGFNRNGATINNVTTDTGDGISVPTHYNVNPGQHLAYQFNQGNGTQQNNVNGDTNIDKNGFGVMTIHVTGQEAPDDKAHDNLIVHLIKIDKKGKQTTQNVSDIVHGRYGDNIKEEAQDFNVPGYYVNPGDTPATIHIDNNGYIHPNQVSFVYNQNPTNNAGDINLTYINQNGQKVSPDGNVGSASDQPDVIHGQGMFGQTINVTNGNKRIYGASDNSAIGENVPTGYTIDPGQKIDYTFDYDTQNVVVMVEGNKINPSDDKVNSDQLTIQLKKHDANGHYQNSDNIHRYIDDQLANHKDLRIGDTIRFAPSQFTPSGYVPTSDEEQTVTVGPHFKNADGTFNNASQGYDIISPSNKTLTFNYNQVKNLSAPLTLTYLNQNGRQVGFTDPILGEKGSTIDVTDPTKGGEAVPDGYNLDRNQKTDYVLSGNAHHIYLHVQGQAVNSAEMTITTVTNKSDGSTAVSDKTENISDLVGNHHINNGDTFNISASDYNPNTSEYQEDYSKDTTQSVTVNGHYNNNGNLESTSVSPNHVVFYYNTESQDQDGQPITLRYINQKGQQVGTTDYLHGKLNSEVNLSDTSHGGEAVPHGYTMSDDTKSNIAHVKFTDSPQIYNVPVTGNQISNAAFTLHQIIEDSDGNPISGKARNFKIGLSDAKVGDTITFNPYNFSTGNSDITSISDGSGSPLNSYNAPSGAHAVNSDADFSVTVQSDGTLSPVNTTDYRYETSHQASAVDTIRVHYVTQSDNGNISLGNGLGKFKEVDEESDRGQAGTSFNLRPYRNDIPETVSQNYTITQVHGEGEAVGQNGNTINDQHLTQFGQNDNADSNGTVKFDDPDNPNTGDVYVLVTPNKSKSDNQPVWIG